MIFITADVLKSAHLDSILCREKFEITFNWFLWASSAHIFSLA